jgi:hypothetical protein
MEFEILSSKFFTSKCHEKCLVPVINATNLVFLPQPPCWRLNRPLKKIPHFEVSSEFLIATESCVSDLQKTSTSYHLDVKYLDTKRTSTTPKCRSRSLCHGHRNFSTTHGAMRFEKLAIICALFCSATSVLLPTTVEAFSRSTLSDSTPILHVDVSAQHPASGRARHDEAYEAGVTTTPTGNHHGDKQCPSSNARREFFGTAFAAGTMASHCALSVGFVAATSAPQAALAEVGSLPEFAATNAILRGITVNVADPSQQESMITFLENGFDMKVLRTRIRGSVEETVSCHWLSRIFSHSIKAEKFPSPHVTIISLLCASVGSSTSLVFFRIRWMDQVAWIRSGTTQCAQGFRHSGFLLCRVWWSCLHPRSIRFPNN